MPLATLAQFKALMAWSETKNDSVVLSLLDRATSIAEELVGRPLMRVQGIVEFPSHAVEQSRVVRLRRAPIESIASVTQLYETGTDAEFDAADVLVENEDFVIDAELGKLERTTAVWYLRRRHLRVIYTGGYVDPARIEVALATATYTAATKTLTQAGAFAGYTFAAGDRIVITGGTGVTKGIYRIAAKSSDNAIVLATAAASTDLATGDITSGYSGMILPPDNLQDAVLQQAIQMWRGKDLAGAESVQIGQANVSLSSLRAHPSLVAVCNSLRYFG